MGLWKKMKERRRTRYGGNGKWLGLINGEPLAPRKMEMEMEAGSFGM
jgi:hypothetical protein